MQSNYGSPCTCRSTLTLLGCSNDYYRTLRVLKFSSYSVCTSVPRKPATNDFFGNSRVLVRISNTTCITEPASEMRMGRTAVRCWCWASSVTEYRLPVSIVARSTCTTLRRRQLHDNNKNSSGDEIANVNFYAVRHGSYPNSLK